MLWWQRMNISFALWSRDPVFIWGLAYTCKHTVSSVYPSQYLNGIALCILLPLIECTNRFLFPQVSELDGRVREREWEVQVLETRVGWLTPCTPIRKSFVYCLWVCMCVCVCVCVYLCICVRVLAIVSGPQAQEGTAGRRAKDAEHEIRHRLPWKCGTSKGRPTDGTHNRESWAERIAVRQGGKIGPVEHICGKSDAAAEGAKRTGGIISCYSQ